jgi:two-component system, sensor histidine kinase and response regulator
MFVFIVILIKQNKTMKRKILVIDDEKRLRSNLAEILTLNNYDVYEASDGTEGLKKTISVEPDIILCDIMMPKSDGYDFIDQLNRTTLSHIPVIFITAKSDREDERKGMNLGAEDYIRKPFTIDEVIKSVEARFKKINKRTEQVKNYSDNSTYELARLINSHNIRSSVNIILGMSGILKNISSDNIDADDLKSTLGYIEQSGWQLISSINNLYYYELTKLKRPDFLEIGPFEEGDTLSSKTNFLVSKYGKLYNREKDFNLNIVGEKISFSLSVFDYIIEELILNAVKFTALHTKIIIDVFSDNYILKIKIQDNGGGFNINNLNEIIPFKKFNDREDVPGFGLGLYNIKRFTELLNGSMKITNLENNFSVSLEIPMNHDNK